MNYIDDHQAIQEAWNKGLDLLIVLELGDIPDSAHLEAVFQDDEVQIVRVSRGAGPGYPGLGSVLGTIANRIAWVSIDATIHLPRNPTQGRQ